jgi:hypothetical protein
LERQQREMKSSPTMKAVPRFQAASNAGDGAGPRVTHQAVTTASVGQPLTVTAEVSDPEGVKWLRLRYRSVNQHQDYRTLPMLPTGESHEYRAVIPAEDISATWDLMYFIEAMGQDGHGRIYPDLNFETPYVVVKLHR